MKNKRTSAQVIYDFLIIINENTNKKSNKLKKTQILSKMGISHVMLKNMIKYGLENNLIKETKVKSHYGKRNLRYFTYEITEKGTILLNKLTDSKDMLSLTYHE